MRKRSDARERFSRRGVFVTLEGIEGCGKTTQARLLGEALGRLGVPHVATREPGGTPIGDEIRSILLRRSSVDLDPTSELLLYEASRAHHCAAVIGPALDEGKVVVCDRFADATIAYQGHGRGLSLPVIRRLNGIASRGLTPDLTILLDCPVEVGLARSSRRLGADGALEMEGRFEDEERAFHERVRRGYLALARRDPRRVWVVEALGGSEAVAEEVQALVLRTLGIRGRRGGRGRSHSGASRTR